MMFEGDRRTTASPTSCFRRSAVTVLTLGLLGLTGQAAHAQLEVSLLDDMVLDTDALLMPKSATYGRAINGVSFQTQPLRTVNGYQYATWYHLGSNEDVYLARRDLNGTTWEVFDTGENFTNGDAPSWDAHNVISMGVAGDGTIHLSWDHHGHTLRYMNTISGVTTNPAGTAWDVSIINAERSSLDVGDPSITGVTYPRFMTAPNGDLLMSYRTGGSGNGDMNIATYDAGTGFWDTPHEIIASTGFYSDALGGSTSRNAYMNGFTYEPDGTIHATWTWRESAGGSNHDINYAYSEDGGSTWLNNDGAVIGTPGSPITIDSPGIIIDDGDPNNGLLGEMDRRNTLMNQQTQTVDLDGRVHTVMWHATDENRDSVSGFTAEPAAYFHYYRDPATGNWTRTELPVERTVGSRPKVAYDADGNLYATYVSRGVADGDGVINYYTDGDLIIAGATKAANYTDWSILYTDTRDFAGEPLLDQQRLLDDGVLSIFIQQNDDVNTGAVGTPLHVLDFNVGAILTWIGDDTGLWSPSGGTDWDSDIDGVGNAAFIGGRTIRFADNAATFNVNVTGPVTPGSVKFENNANAYTFTGAGIGGTGGLSVTGGGTVTLSNAANTYTGDTHVSNGTLALVGNTSIATSPNINITGSGTLDVSGLASPFTLANGQTLNNNSNNTVIGNVVAGNGAVITGDGTFTDDVTVQAGATLRVGDAGMPADMTSTVFNVIDDFSGDLSAYTNSVILDTDTGGGPNTAAWQITGGTLGYSTSSYQSIEQAAFIRNGLSLAVGEEVRVDVDHSGDSQDIGLYVGGTTPAAGVREDYISVYARDNGQVLTRGFDGTSEYGLVGGGSPSYDSLFVARTGVNTFEVGYYTGGIRNVLTTRTPLTPNDADVIGFYTDVRATGVLGNLDNFGILTAGDPVMGQVLSILGNLTLQSGATLELDAYSPVHADKLDVGGHLAAAGTLVVTLDPAAPSPQFGDTFDILDFVTASGSFDALTLPALEAGLFWDTTGLLTTGELIVVDSIVLEGDLNGDGFVGIADLNIILGAWNQNVTPGSLTAGDPSGDGFVGIADLNVVLGNWNAGAAPGAPTANATIPEPAGFVLFGLVATGVVRRCR